jgi:hypothetical protein
MPASFAASPNLGENALRLIRKMSLAQNVPEIGGDATGEFFTPSRRSGNLCTPAASAMAHHQPVASPGSERWKVLGKSQKYRVTSYRHKRRSLLL